MKKIATIFLLSFVLNLIWEHFHSKLYGYYQGGEITNYILFRASVWDAVIITTLVTPFLYSSFLKSKIWLFVALCVLASILIELYAMATFRWSYNELMPIIPIVKIGLSPTIQLGLTGYLAFVLAKILNRG